MKFNLDRMVVFAAVIENGSFTEASYKLSLSKSVVSHHINKLEQQLGVKLLNRTTRRLALTEVGERYYLKCREVLQIAEIAREEASDFSNILAGPITVTIPHALMKSIVGVRLTAFFAQHQKLEPNIINDDLKRELIDERIDLAISAGALTDSSYKTTRIGTLTESLYVSPKYIKSREKLKFPEGISKLDYIANKWEGSIIRIPLKEGRNSKTIFHGAATRKATDIFAVQAMAVAGLGVARLPTHLVENDIKNNSLVKLFPEHDAIVSPISIQHAFNDKLPVKIRACIDHLKNQKHPT